MPQIRLSAAVLLFIGLLLTGGIAPPAAQEKPAEPPPQDAVALPAQQPTFRGRIDLVRVDAFVTRDGKPVTDLTQDDFELFEDGKPQPIEQFRAVDVDEKLPVELPSGEARDFTDSEIQTLQDDTARLFVFFLDDYHTREANAIRIREPLIRFIRTQLRPTDLLGVMYPLMSSNDVVFTRDHDDIVAAINNFNGRKYRYDSLNQYERNYERASIATIERIRNQVVQGALEALSIRLGGLREERKTILLVSEGFTVMLPPAAYQVSPAGAMLLSNPTSGVDPNAEVQGQMELDIRMREVYRAANRFNTSIYSVDPRGLSVFESDIADPPALRGGQDLDRQMMRASQGTLRDLALETDGRVVMNRNSLADGLGEVLTDTRQYYLLGYTTPSEPDGKFHEIRVRVKRPGVQVRARKGFWALNLDNFTRATTPRTPEMPKPFQQALATLASPVKAARAVRTWVGTEQGTGGKTRVTLVWEPVAAPAGSPDARRETPGRVSLMATAGGDLVYRGRSEPPAGPSAPGATASPSPSAPQQLSFEAPPGKLELRLTVEGASGGTIDTDQRTIEVPDLGAAGAALSTPRVYRARTARDVGLIAKDPAAVPIAAREFSRTERLLVRFDVYAAGGEKPQPKAAVLNRSGQKMADVPVAAATTGGTHQIDLGLNTIAAGEYVLEISVQGATGETAIELVAFRIGA